MRDYYDKGYYSVIEHVGLTDLNAARPIDADAKPGEDSFQDNSVVASDGRSCVYFRNLADRLTEHIRSADTVFGCVAWLTDFRILEALRGKKVSIVVQKEDFLRPDAGADAGWKARLQTAYSAINGPLGGCEVGGLNHYDVHGSIETHRGCDDVPIGGIRCAGNHNRDRNPAHPRMHNKFLVFAKRNPTPDDRWTCGHTCYGVWTGSFNFTTNGGRSLENAVYLTDPNIVRAYRAEHRQIVAISEPLDWQSEWCCPVHRLGS